MTGLTPRSPRTMGVHPSTLGYGWAVFESPVAPYDWGVSYASGRATDKNADCLTKVEAMLERYQPETLVLEAFERRFSNRSSRMTLLGRSIAAMATARGIEVVIYTKGEVQRYFETIGARTRYEIATAISRQLDILRPQLPPKRKPWNGEDYRMTLFSAAALILTHYRTEAGRLLDELKGPKNPEKPQENA